MKKKRCWDAMTKEGHSPGLRLLLLASFALIVICGSAWASACSGGAACGGGGACGTGCICYTTTNTCVPSSIICENLPASNSFSPGNCINPSPAFGQPLGTYFDGYPGPSNRIGVSRPKYVLNGGVCNDQEAVVACTSSQFKDAGGIWNSGIPVCCTSAHGDPETCGGYCDCSTANGAGCWYAGCSVYRHYPAPPDPYYFTAMFRKCETFNGYPEACQATSSSVGYTGCQWQGTGGGCTAVQGTVCSSNTECCNPGFPICLTDPITFDMSCQQCIPLASADLTPCAQDSDCCSGLACDSGTSTCVPNVNNPPLQPAMPIITPVPFVSDSGLITCESCIVPSDPDNGDTVSLEYRWEVQRFGSVGFATLRDWAASPPNYQCTLSSCDDGDQIRLLIRGVDNHGAPTGVGPPSDPSGFTTVQAAPPPPPPSFICSSSNYSNVMSISALAGVAMAALVALVYLFGEFFQNARMITWAKTEAMQVFVSLAVVAVILFVLSAFCTFQAGEIRTMFGFLPSIFDAPNDVLEVFPAAAHYLEGLMKLSLSNIAALRYNLGAYEIRTSFTKFECDALCLFALTSTDVAIYGGETVNLAITNNLLSTANLSYLSAAFMYFTLQYISNGLFLEFLPLAIVIRSIPFMRQFGGALIGIFLALYLLYPIMIIADAAIAPGLAGGPGAVVLYNMDSKNCPGKEIFTKSGDDESLICNPHANGFNEQSLGWPGTSKDDMDSIAPTPLASSLKINVLIFLTAVFLPAINFIAIAAIGRDLSHLLGEEADISRLGQMV